MTSAIRWFGSGAAWSSTLVNAITVDDHSPTHTDFHDVAKRASFQRDRIEYDAALKSLRFEICCAAKSLIGCSAIRPYVFKRRLTSSCHGNLLTNWLKWSAASVAGKTCPFPFRSCMFVSTHIGSAIATTPRQISTQSQAMPASPSPENPPQTVCPEHPSTRSRLLVTLVAKCTNLGRRLEFACQNTGGQEYSAHGGGVAITERAVEFGVLCSMTRSLERLRCEH
jgi:hypothetical protein